MKKILSKLMFWNKKKIEEEKEDIPYFSPTEIEFPITTEHLILDIEYINKLDDSKPTILLMDDFKAMVNLLAIELKRINSINIYEEFNIISATGEFAAFTVQKYIDEGNCVDVAFLDITLGGVIANVELDGIDVAIMIKECNPDSNIKFITGHTLNRKNPEIFKFAQKFESFFTRLIDEEITIKDGDNTITVYEHIIGKNDNRILLMEHAISEFLKNQGK